MRVGLVIYGSLETLSGGYYYDRRLVHYLREQGDQVEVFSLPFRTYARHLSDNLSAGLLTQLVKSNIDLLLQDELNHPSLFLLNRRLKSMMAVPLISIVHHLRCSEPGHWPGFATAYRQIERAYLRTLDGVVYNSNTTRLQVESLLGYQLRAIVAFPGSDRLSSEIDEVGVDRRARQPGPLRLLFLGNLIPRKGLHVLLEALRQLADIDWRLTVVGSLVMAPSYVAAIRRKAAPWVGSGRLVFTGPLDQVRLQEAFLSHQVLVVPSLYEGYGIVFGEAMGFGLPGVGTDAGAMGEIITDGRDGFLLPSGDPEPLAGAIRRLSMDRGLLSEMSLAARRRYASLPTWEKMGREIRRFLIAIAAEKYN